MDQKPDENRKRTFTEEIEVAGSDLVEQVKSILKEGNVRQLKIKAEDGDVYLETPLTIGVIAALVAHVRIEIEREADDDDGGEGTPAEG